MFCLKVVIAHPDWKRPCVDIIVEHYKNKEDAIAASIKYHKNTIQIFKKKEDNGYEPSYLYYINGKLQSNI